MRITSRLNKRKMKKEKNKNVSLYFFNAKIYIKFCSNHSWLLPRIESHKNSKRRGLLSNVPVSEGTSTLGKRRGEKSIELAQRLRKQQHFADREFAFGTIPGIEHARVRATLTTCPESDHHVVAKSKRSAILTKVSQSLLFEAETSKKERESIKILLDWWNTISSFLGRNVKSVV